MILTDRLLVEVASERRTLGEVWDYEKDFKEMQATSQVWKEYGTESWYPKAIEMFEAWVVEDAEGKK